MNLKAVDQDQIVNLLKRRSRPSRDDVNRVILKGTDKKGLSLEDVAVLVNANEPDEINKMFHAASKIKEEIYGERLVLFAPLYISDYCVNECAYCGFHLTNEAFKRRMLSLDEIAKEAECLINMGHKRVLIEFGEDPDKNSIDYVCSAIKTIYGVKGKGGNSIRRVNVNIASTSVENYRRLEKEGIGTYQLFQETYHRDTYEKLHKGLKGDYDRQITAHDRAREAGLDDLGIGALFGLYDWRFETMALVAHAEYMESHLGVGPHTISVPRFCGGEGINYRPEYPVGDEEFLKLITILRIAVPYAGLILSTREPPDLRRRAFQMGISQASAASVCTPGGYAGKRSERKEQFEIQDDRPVDEVVRSVIDDGLLPSFCTACYRIGRTGKTFMDLAKSGDIHEFCRPNAILTFAEYLEDFGDERSKDRGGKIMAKFISRIISPKLKAETLKKLEEIKSGKRDLFF
ncbi:MAG: [FeFe] hydrogenase H-cluster radical SAM maturase HydG [Deltaproteobacteria bacterium CG11_big_fil_rev_8_21_14_0_20_49_13]|nr:MAG: [FeFe] hydrogenase H-cluster radical SAM maturase HydG [Deltaproteobacteria bacterium CG11_big_fil_rev_8_21_14_0_20_49_13]